jgi:proline iminopeptidase
MKNGYVQSPAGELYYELSGESSRAPLVCVHGGPGFTGYYLEPLRALSDLLPVVIYDQAGCGRARRGGERKLMTVDAFVTELEALRVALGVESMHLYGHSFGGLIIGEYALRFPTHVASATFASVSIDIPRWIADGERLLGKMPLLQKMILREGNRLGSTSSAEYVQALESYYDRHVYGDCRGDSRITASIEESDPKTYERVWGANELLVNGLVRDYSLSPRLHELTCPVLFTCGRFDEATPEAHEYFSSCVAGSRCFVFELSAHHPQISEEDSVLSVMREFLCSVSR